MKYISSGLQIEPSSFITSHHSLGKYCYNGNLWLVIQGFCCNIINRCKILCFSGELFPSIKIGSPMENNYEEGKK